MANERKHIAHVKSAQTITENGVTYPKLPTASDIILGELAVNYATGHERISLKNAAGNIVPFVSKEYVDDAIKPVQTTGTSTTEIMSQNAVTVALNTKANSADVYTKTESNNLIFGQNTVPSGTGAATNVQQLINKTVYGTTTPSQAQTAASVVTTENLTTTLSGYATTSAIADFFDGAEYTNGTGTYAGKKVIAFKHGNTVKVQVDATDFIKDGMLTNAEIKNVTISGQSVKCLVLTFNTDSGKSDINIPIADIFDASNYVAKSEVDTVVSTSIENAVTSQSPSQAQTALNKAISDAVAKAISDALKPGATDTTVVQQIDNTITQYTYTPSGGSAISLTDVMEASHTHANKAVLDGITSEKVTAWNNASANGVTNVAYNGTSHKITKTIGSTTTDVVSASTIVTDGGGIKSHQTVTDNNPTLAWSTKSKVATIGSTEINVTMPAKPSYNASDVGLGNVGNFKAVSTVASQGLTSTEQANARANIGAGTSSFSGNYSDLNGKPTLGNAAAKAVDSSISASSSSVNLPTSAAVANFVEGKGYSTTNTTYKLTIGNTTNGDSVNGVNLGTLESKAAAASGTDLSLVTTGEKNVWNNKQNAIVFNTAYNASTNKAATMGDVPTHKTAANGGTDLSVVTTGEMYTWNNKSNLTIGTTGTTAAAGNHTHNTSIATSSGTNQLTLAASTKYAITAGGTSYVFTTPPNTTYSDASTSASGLMSASDKTKLNGIATGAEANQNAFSYVKVGTTTISADSKTDTLELVAGSNVQISPDATNDKITISATNTTYSDASTSASGLMSASDKTKLNGIATGATAVGEATVSGWGFTKNAGTVTSVGITVPTGLSVSGSPITTSGTLAITLTNGYVIPQQTTLNSFLKGTIEVVSVTADNNSYSAGTIAQGTQKHVIFNNGGSADYVVTIPTTYRTPDGQAITLTVPNGGYAEANFMNINGTVYVRGL